MPKYILQYVCGHSDEEEHPEARIDKIREQAAESLCPSCWTHQQNQFADEIGWLLPPLEGTEKQVTWAQRLRAKRMIEILNAKAAYGHDETMSLILNDFHQDAVKQSLATWWINNRNIRLMDLVSDYHSPRQSYYQFMIENRFQREVDALVKEAQETNRDPFDIDAEQGLLGAILVKNDAYYVASFLEPEHFIEDLHRRIFEVIRALITFGKVATPITLNTFLGDQDLGGITVSQYLARLAAEAVGITQVRQPALTIYALAKYRSQMQSREPETQEMQA
jgi:hypothetical protein